MKIINGDYVPDAWGGFVTCTGAEEKLERILYKLMCRRGGFAPMPDLGSRLYLLLKEKKEHRNTSARKYILEALENEEGLSLVDVQVLSAENGLLVKADLKLSGLNESLTVHLS